MPACGDITLLTLHQQCTFAPSGTPAYGQLVTRVDGGWIYQRLVNVPDGQRQARGGVFIPEDDPPNLYVVANVFDMALDAELELGLTEIPAYDFLVRAVPDGWDYYPLITVSGGQKQARDPIFVPRAKAWIEQEYTADGTTSLTLTGGQAAPTDDIANQCEVWVGNGARRNYNASPADTEHFGTSGTTTITWPTNWFPVNGEKVTVRTLQNVSV